MQESGGGILGDPLPVPSLELQSAVVQSAHKHGLITIAHALTQKDTLAVLAAGTDALAHSFHDEPPRDDLLDAYRKNNSFLVPTLIVSASLLGDEKQSTERFSNHPMFGKFLDEKSKTCFCGKMMMAKEGHKTEYAYQMVRMLHKAGIDIVAYVVHFNRGSQLIGCCSLIMYLQRDRHCDRAPGYCNGIISAPGIISIRG